MECFISFNIKANAFIKSKYLGCYFYFFDRSILNKFNSTLQTSNKINSYYQRCRGSRIQTILILWQFKKPLYLLSIVGTIEKYVRFSHILNVYYNGISGNYNHHDLYRFTVYFLNQKFFILLLFG